MWRWISCLDISFIWLRLVAGYGKSWSPKHPGPARPPALGSDTVSLLLVTSVTCLEAWPTIVKTPTAISQGCSNLNILCHLGRCHKKMSPRAFPWPWTTTVGSTSNFHDIHQFTSKGLIRKYKLRIGAVKSTKWQKLLNLTLIFYTLECLKGLFLNTLSTWSLNHMIVSAVYCKIFYYNYGM